MRKEVSTDKNGLRTTAFYFEESELPAKRSGYAICVKTDDPDLLTPSRLYKVDIVGEYIAVTDNEGEAAVYPADFFVPLSLSHAEKMKLETVLV